MSKNRITKMFLMGLALILTGIVCMLGVMAITDSKLVNFKLGTKYEPAFNIEVYTTTIYNQNETKSLVFKSVNPSEVNYNAHYIDSVTNDTILFKTENLKTDNGVVVLTIVNNENKSLQAIINKGAQVEVIDAGAEKAISVEIGTTNLGLFLFSLQIVEYAPYGASYNLSGCSLIIGPEIIASETITSEIILQANDVDFTKWTISATSGEIETEYIWQSAQMQVKILLKNVTEATTLTAKAEIDYWDGTAEAFPYGNGTEENPYLIRNGKHLHYLADVTNNATAREDGQIYSNLSYKLMNNIYLNTGTFNEDGTFTGTNIMWEPIGKSGEPIYDEDGNTIYNPERDDTNNFSFRGIFDVANFVIKGIYIVNLTETSLFWHGLFGCIGVNGIVKNVNIGNGYLETWSRTGGVCGVSFGRVENCTNLATINSQNYHVGGICGINRDGVIINCTNSAKVTGKNVVGGVCGLNGTADNDNIGYIQKCYNFGNVLGLGIRTGGVIGWNGAYVLDCFNKGIVEGIGNYVGGVIGSIDDIKKNVLVDNCHNTGAVTGWASYVGGVCGYSTSKTITNADSTTTTYTPTISNCWNSGVIENIGNAAYSDVGGLLGSSSFTYINSCFNYGNVYGYGHCVGGILGRGKADLLLCINYGLISGDSDSQGGIVGHLNAGGTLEKCINYGAVSGFKNYIAGLVAHNAGKMYNSYNAGHVFGDGSYVGGVCGVNNTIGNGEGFIYNCFNLGVIKGIKNVGGVVGVSYQSNSTDSNKPIIKNCYNFGGVSATSFVAGVISENRTTSTLTATYYWSAFCSTGIGSGSGTATAVTTSNYTTAMNALNSNVNTNNSNASNVKWLKWQIDATGCPSFVE